MEEEKAGSIKANGKQNAIADYRQRVQQEKELQMAQVGANSNRMLLAGKKEPNGLQPHSNNLYSSAQKIKNRNESLLEGQRIQHPERKQSEENPASGMNPLRGIDSKES